MFSFARLTSFVSLFILLTGCGGGGGGGGGDNGSNSDQFTVSTNALSISADIEGDTPPSKSVSGTVNNVNSSVRVDIVIGGTAIASAQFSFVGQNSGQLQVTPKSPDSLGIGHHTDQIVVYVCTDLLGCVGSPTQVSGSPKTIAVSYDVTVVPQVRYVAPLFTGPDAAGDVIIRGIGFSQLNSPTVSFGNVSASSFQVVTDTEIRATHPSLSAGDYQVNIDATSGAVPSEATLHVKAEPALGYAFISSVGTKNRVLYDVARGALYTANNGAGKVERFVHSVDPESGDEVWTESSLTITGVNDIALTPDGKELLAIDTSLIRHINLDTFSVTDFVTALSYAGNRYLGQIGVANNGICYVAPRINGTGGVWPYRYNSRKKRVTLESSLLVSQGTVGVSGDGDKLLITDGSRDSINYMTYLYDAAQDRIVAPATKGFATTLAMDRTGATVMFGREAWFSSPATRTIYHNSTNLGSISCSNGVPLCASAISPDGSLFYSYDAATKLLTTYDLTASDGNGGFNTVGNSLSITDSVGTNLVPIMASTASGGTLFVAGESGIVVQPLP